MNVVNFDVRIISRNNGRSAVQMAAYCGRDRLYNEKDKRTYDYTKREDLVHHEVMLPDHAPEIFRDSSTLWNSVEKVERNKRSQLARSVYFALPREFDHNTQIAIARQFVQDNFVDKGMCADLSIHDKGDGNPHAHVLLTTRSLDKDGHWMYKRKRNYIRNEKGEKIRDPITKRYQQGPSIKANNWDDRGNVEQWRANLAGIFNAEFEKQGIGKQVTHKSYARQGINREPTKHLGAKVKALKDRGILTDRSKENQAIKERNRERAREEERQKLREQYIHTRDRDYGRSR